MRNILIFIFLICQFVASTQKPSTSYEILTFKQVNQLFTDIVKVKLNINFPIFRVYKYIDKTGENYCLLTESRNEITADNDTLHHHIKAINVRVVNNTFFKTWEIIDNIDKNNNEENSIW